MWSRMNTRERIIDLVTRIQVTRTQLHQLEAELDAVLPPGRGGRPRTTPITPTPAAPGRPKGRRARAGSLASRVIELTGSTSEIVYVPYNEAYSEGFEDMRRRVPDVSKLRATIGYSPDTSLDEALRRIIAVYPSSTAPVS